MQVGNQAAYDQQLRCMFLAHRSTDTYDVRNLLWDVESVSTVAFHSGNEAPLKPVDLALKCEPGSGMPSCQLHDNLWVLQ